jgi:diadenosine tetraphosphate (Ap4A) HIT family hydrolase
VPEADRVLETERVIGFFDWYPVGPGHLLLIPKQQMAAWCEQPGGLTAPSQEPRGSPFATIAMEAS